MVQDQIQENKPWVQRIGERRKRERRRMMVFVAVERRMGDERRQGPDRRSINRLMQERGFA